MITGLKPSWETALKEEFEKDYFKNLLKFLGKEYQEKMIYPPKEDVFNVFRCTDISNIKVVILGQDPYPNEGQAHGFSFSVPEGIKVPVSLKRIYKEIENEFGYKCNAKNGNLIPWVNQGVFLLNTALTINPKARKEHRKIVWKNFTDAVIEIIEKQDQPIVYFLWGNDAREKRNMIKNPNHLVLEAKHPSPRSARKEDDDNYLGCGHFKKANAFLREHGVEEINWKIE